MRLRTIVLLAIVVVRPASASEKDQIPIVVCVDDAAIEPTDFLMARTAIGQGEILAAEMLGSAGVHTEWHGVRHCPPQSVFVSLHEDTSPRLMPGVLAYAKPFDGSSAITVFYDRISRRAGDRPSGPIVGHVLAHEIAHLLQRVDRHSATGLMKATWTMDDFRQMYYLPLRFTQDDIDLIQLGASRGAVAISAFTE